MPSSFSVTFEIVTPESAEHGDAESMGFISEVVDLRDAISDLFETRTSRCDGIQDLDFGDWITVRNGVEFQTGAYESRALHFPRHATESSRNRVARLIRNYAGFA